PRRARAARGDVPLTRLPVRHIVLWTVDNLDDHDLLEIPMHAGHFLTRAAERYPDRPAWIDARGAVSFRQAASRVARLAGALAALGLEPGDRVGLLVANCPEGLESILGPMQAGMAVVPMNARLHPDEHAYMLNDSGARALIYGADFAAHVGKMRGRVD